MVSFLLDLIYCTQLLEKAKKKENNENIVQQEIQSDNEVYDMYEYTCMYMYSIWVSIKEQVGMDSDWSYFVFSRKHNRNLQNNWIIPIRIHSDLFHNRYVKGR